MKVTRIAELASSLTFLAGVIKFFEIGRRKIQDTEEMETLSFSGKNKRMQVLQSIQNIRNYSEELDLRITKKKQLNHLKFV